MPFRNISMGFEEIEPLTHTGLSKGILTKWGGHKTYCAIWFGNNLEYGLHNFVSAINELQITKA